MTYNGARRSFYCLIALLAGLSGSVACGDDEPRESAPDERLEHLLLMADQLEIRAVPKTGEPKTAKRVARTLLRYKNPVYPAQSDGALLLWTIDDVPVVLSSMSIRNENSVFREMVSFAERPLECTLRSRPVWKPTNGGFKRQAFPDAPEPPENERVRQIQMKRLFDRFEVNHQRKLPTPLYRYKSPANGIVDGAVFTTTTANDPEILVLIEAYKSEDGTLGWRYSLARMNSFPMTVKLDGEAVWSVEGYWDNPRGMGDPYMETRHSTLPSELSRTEK